MGDVPIDAATSEMLTACTNEINVLYPQLRDAEASDGDHFDDINRIIEDAPDEPSRSAGQSSQTQTPSILVEPVSLPDQPFGSSVPFVLQAVDSARQPINLGVGENLHEYELWLAYYETLGTVGLKCRYHEQALYVGRCHSDPRDFPEPSILTLDTAGSAAFWIVCHDPRPGIGGDTHTYRWELSPVGGAIAVWPASGTVVCSDRIVQAPTGLSDPPAPKEESATASDSAPAVVVEANTRMTVIGVRHDDTLNVRDAPNGEIVARLQPVFSDARQPFIRVLDPHGTGLLTETSLDGVIAAGRTERLSRSVWHQVEIGGVTGWASDAYLAELGEPDEERGLQVQAVLDSVLPAETYDRLERRVLAALTELDTDAKPVIVGQVSPVEGVGGLIVDLLVDSGPVRGYRVEVWVRAAGDWMRSDWGTVGGPFSVAGSTTVELH